MSKATIIFMDNPQYADDPTAIPIISQTVPSKLKTGRKDVITWKISDGYPALNIPPVSNIPDFDCDNVSIGPKGMQLPTSAPANGACKIKATVQDVPTGAYFYSVYYDDSGSLWTTEDPELDVSGTFDGRPKKKARPAKARPKKKAAARRGASRKKK